MWLEHRPQNAPGTFQERPNWRRTASMTLEQIAADAGITATLTRVAAARDEAARRAPTPPCVVASTEN